MFNLEKLCIDAKKASEDINKISESKINEALALCSKYLLKASAVLQSENKKDIDNAEKKGLSAAFIDRLKLTDKVIADMACGIEKVAQLDTPVGKVIYSYFNKEQDIKIEKKNVPFGVIGIIFESRPNVTADAFALCFKTHNAVILKGGSDAINSNRAIVSVLQKALNECGINKNAVSLIDDTSRETTEKFMKMNEFVDLLIPRGGAKLIKTAVENSTIPIIETGTGNCHAYVDKCADVDMAAKIIFNAKTQRYSVCNALESIVVHSEIAAKALPEIADKLSCKGVEMRLDDRAYRILKDYANTSHATEEDFYTEYGAPIISVKTVDSLVEAVEHINKHSTKHSETIITNDDAAAEYFLKNIDSACVYHNASTRFSDGFVFGLGAEIGISTQKLHARGPMGLEALVTTKYIIKGDGAVRK